MQTDSKWQPEWSQGNCGRLFERPLSVERSAVDADCAEAEQNAATGLRTAEAGLRTEVREHHDLVDLALHGLIVRAGKNSVGDDLALRVQGGFEQQRHRAGVAGVSGTAGQRERRQTFKAR